MRKKNPPIKHKLWGKLKREAEKHYKVFPWETMDLYEIRYWNRNHYASCCDDSLFMSNEMDALKETLERKRDAYFKSLCFKALYQRRRKKVINM